MPSWHMSLSKRWKIMDGSHPERCWKGWDWPRPPLDPLFWSYRSSGFWRPFAIPEGCHPMIAGTFGAMLTTWATFVPCFLWVLVGGPYVESVRGNKSLHAAMSSITAAIVGVVLNLAVWFALHTIFGSVRDVHAFGGHLQIPVWSTVSIPSLIIATIAMVAIFRFKLGVMQTIGCSAAIGIIYHLSRWALS